MHAFRGASAWPDHKAEVEPDVAAPRGSATSGDRCPEWHLAAAGAPRSEIIRASSKRARTYAGRVFGTHRVATFKSELVDGRRFPSYEHAEHETLNWISFYNNERLHEELGDLPPADCEQLNIKKDNKARVRAT